MFSLIIILFSSFICCFSKNVHNLSNGEIITINPRATGQLDSFCYIGKPKYIIHIWQSVLLQINHPTDEYTQYDGASHEEVQKQYFDKRYSWPFPNILSSKLKSIKLNPFNTSCVGIESKDPYSVHLSIIRVDLWKILLLATGVLLFMLAGKLSTNIYFHYICGVSLGICASFLISIYFISKLFPRKTLMYGFIGCGWTIVIYALQILWENIQIIVSKYSMYVIWYTVITGFISFILCYRWGPVENSRTKHLIKWVLQGAGLLSIFYSSYFQEAAMAQIIGLLIFHNLPKRWMTASRSYWHKTFPPKLKRLTNDEYYEEGVRETTKALDELRQYCLSPMCNQWKTALKIKDVKRFASFIEGNSHLSDEEILEYETSVQEAEVTDDEQSEALTDDERDDY